MGIKHYFYWFKNRFADHIYKLKKGETIKTLFDGCIMDDTVSIDNLMIDMNGLFHHSTQKIYEYGEFKRPAKILKRRNPKKKKLSLKKQLQVFEDICKNIEKILQVVEPRKRLVLCVDGPAPNSKQNQQRQRRFKSALERKDNDMSFDSNSITPGTKFMDFLTKYIDWYIRKKMSEKNSLWSKLEVVFSNEKSPGEGEHKIINFIRQNNNKDESYCIHGMDADLIMLALGTHHPNFYILREEPMDPSFNFYLINIGEVYQQLGEIMRWNDSDRYKYSVECAINDFIFMCFTVGNDFLPHVPSMEIIEGSIDFMFDVYINVCESYGHLTKITENGPYFRKKSVKMFMGNISQYEQGVLEEKMNHKDRFFPDPILEAHVELKEGKYNLDIKSYRNNYYDVNFDTKDIRKLCHNYLEGMQWVLSYYTRGVPNWKWKFPHHYAPFAHTIAKFIGSFKFPTYSQTQSTVPFIQLLSVLPPKSSHLLPKPLNTLLSSTNSPLSKYCPDNFNIDLSGKRAEWEGTVILPIVDYTIVEHAYYQLLQKVDKRELKRNRLGKSFVYTPNASEHEFRSFYGNIKCTVSTRTIEL